ncbi:MAG TPA: hypothetical protein VE010_11930 [Thermoanaerobaculia bacterium]|nr:hypothetical protein [Thermoanaerobaculia bacterium]
MRRLMLLGALLLATVVAQPASAALKYVVIDGSNGTIVGTDLTTADRPRVQRLGAGFYRLTFRFNVVVFAGHAQSAGGAGDATALLFTSTYDPAKPREIHVSTIGAAAGSPLLTRQDGRMTIIVNR